MIVLGSTDGSAVVREPGPDWTYRCVSKAVADGQVSNAYAYIKRNTSTNNDSKIVVYNNSGQIVTNGISNTVSSSGQTTGVWYLKTYTFSNPVSIVSGQIYWIVLYSANTGWLSCKTSLGTGGRIDQSGTFASPGSCVYLDSEGEKLNAWLEYEPTSDVITYSTPGIIGSNSPSGSVRTLPSPNNRGAYITPTTDFAVDYVGVYCRASNTTYQSGMNGYIGVLSGNTLSPILDGYLPIIGSVNTTSHWETMTTVHKPVLSANTTYFVALKGLGASYYFILYYVSATTPNTHGTNASYAVDEPDRLFSIYLSGNYLTPTTPPGPALKIEGITPGKLEYTSWSNINTVR